MSAKRAIFRFAIPTGMTNRFGFDLSTVVADSFQNLLDLGQETLRIVHVSKVSQDRTGVPSHTNMVDRSCELDVSEMSRAFFLAFLTSLTVPLAINRSQTRIIKTLCPRSLSLFILSSLYQQHQATYVKLRQKRKECKPLSLDTQRGPHSSV